MTTIERTFCKCGCGQEVTGGKEYYNGTCRTRYHRQQKGKAGTEATQDVTGEEETDAQPVTVLPGEAAREISEKAQREIDGLRARLQELGSEHQSLNQERHQLLTDQAGRADHRQQLRSGVQALETAYQDAMLYASVAMDTIGEAEAVRQVNAALKAIEPARAHAEQIEAHYDEQDGTAAARLQEIDVTLASLSTESQSAHIRLMEVEQVRDRSVRELGAATYEAMMTEYQGYQERLEELKRQTLQAQVERVQMLERARETLHAWPELVRKIAGLDEYDDATARIIRTALSYCELLISEGVHIDRNVRTAVTSNYYNWLELLAISREELYIEETVGGPQRMLRRRAQLLRQLLDQYVATKR